jgi:hypothetical protein
MENNPRNILYATSARIGGVGLDAVACETLRGIQDRLGKAIAFGVRTPGFDRSKIVTLAWHPVRLLSNLDRKYYYPAKKFLSFHQNARAVLKQPTKRLPPASRKLRRANPGTSLSMG